MTRPSPLCSLLVMILIGGGILLPAVPVGAQANFIRGDCNTDGANNIADIIFLLGALFTGGTAPTCEAACDYNDDGGLNIADAIRGLSFLFSGGDVLPPPADACGTDPTLDPLTCVGFPPCQAMTLEICENGIDDDLDGSVDCDDSDCFGEPTCLIISHANDMQPIWDTHCVSCHAPPVPAASLNLTPAAAFGQLVGFPSLECSSFDRVAPGSPFGSWLFRKITGTQNEPDVLALGCSPAQNGAQMPLGPACCLEPSVMLLIEAWISDGAPP